MVKQNIELNAKVEGKRRIDDLNKSLGQSQKALGGLGTAAKVAAGALATIGAGKALKSFVDVGRSVENLQLKFKFLFGSATEGAAAFETLSEFAATVPFSLDQIAAASGNLAVVSEDASELGKNLQLAGNIAAVSGLDFQTAGEQLQRALSGGIGAADLLREKGITALLGFKQGTKVTVEETAEALQRVFGPGGEFGGAAESLAQTFDGVVSMIGDKMFNFQRIVGEEFVGELTNSFGDLNKFLAENQETIDTYARALGIGLARAVEATGDGIKFLRENSEELALAFKILISLKIAAMFIRMGRAIIPVVAATRALVSLSGVGLPLVAASVVAATATYIAMDKAIDGVEKKMGNLVDTAKDKNLAEAVGAIEDAMIVEDPAVKAAKDAQKLQQAVDALLAKEKQFIRQMEQLGEDALQKNLRQEQENIERLEKLRQTDVANYQKYTDLINKVEAEAAAEREAIYKKEAEAKRRRQEADIALIRSGKAADVDMTGKSEQEKRQIMISSGKSILEDLATMNKKAFELNKAVAIAEAIINTYQGATKALAQGGIFGPILAATVVASGLAQVAAIRSQQYQGRQRGGPVSPGETYVIGEAGPELFSPSTSGSITPNNKAFEGDAGGTTINFNISTVDARGFDELLQTRQDLIITLVNRGLTERGRPRLI